MIYFDNAATTPVHDSVKRDIIEALDIFGNPSSQYDLGKASKRLLEEARRDVAQALDASDNTIIFTGSGSEADTFAIRAGWWHGQKRGRNKILISSIEHHAIAHAAEQLKAFGAEIVYVNVNDNGTINLEDLKNKIDSKTALVSIMASNNEVGTSMDIFSIYQLAHKHGALFHTDAVQGITHMHIPSVCFDMMSISGHKFGAPKGIGAICINHFLKEDLHDFFLIAGGKQEYGMRGGTENVPYIVGFAKALKQHKENMKEIIRIEADLHNYLLQQLQKNFPYIKINGMSDPAYKNPGILNFSIDFADAASLVEWMNLHDICISSGSACNTGSPKPSHVLMAMYNDEKRAFSSIRVSLSYRNTQEEIDAFIKALKAFERVYKQ